MLKAKREWKKEIISKECLVLGKVALLRGLSDYLPVLTEKFQVGWLKVTFLGEAEATVGLGIKSR